MALDHGRGARALAPRELSWVGQMCNCRRTPSVIEQLADYWSMRRFLVAASPALATLALLCGAAPVRAASSPRPVVALLTVPKTVVAGRPPRVSLRIVEPGVMSVDARVTVTALSTHEAVIVTNLGWVRTGHTLTVAWPSSATLTPGSYRVSVSAHDRRGETLRRGARTSGEASLTVDAPTPVPTEIPVPVFPSMRAPEPAPEAGVPTVAQTVADGAVFPVAGPHNFGGPENVFGAPRTGYLHQGQDILTAEGTPVLAPLAGTILTTSFQEAGAGYYAVEETAIGLDFMFAHCQASSLAVGTGQAVSAGQVLCKAGQTGDATAPHLDFEIWVGGWQAAGGRPINPLPYLEAWEG